MRVKDKGGPSKGGFQNDVFIHTYHSISLHKWSVIQETTFTRTTFVLRQGSQTCWDDECVLSDFIIIISSSIIILQYEP